MSNSAYCLTIGDPSGIGPEITAKILQESPLSPESRIIVIGNIPHLEKTAESLGLELPSGYQTIEYINIPGNVDKEPGTIAYMALEKAVEIVRRGIARALVTGPISKENLHKSGIRYSGHTEILQTLAQKYYRNDYQADMIFVYQQFRMLLLTRHVALRHVSQTLTVPGVAQSLGNLVEFLRTRQKIMFPRICLMGVNPHAGEIDGEEERNILLPAIQAVSRQQNIYIDPPFPADALFRGFDVDNPGYDAYVASYHDQGLIPFKLVAGLKAVNVTIGLPFLRTSVSHGMATDIVGKGVADPCSLVEAFRVAEQLA